MTTTLHASYAHLCVYSCTNILPASSSPPQPFVHLWCAFLPDSNEENISLLPHCHFNTLNVFITQPHASLSNTVRNLFVCFLQICTNCVCCKRCGATKPGKSWDAQWSHDFSMCHDCAKLLAKGVYNSNNRSLTVVFQAELSMLCSCFRAFWLIFPGPHIVFFDMKSTTPIKRKYSLFIQQTKECFQVFMFVSNQSNLVSPKTLVSEQKVTCIATTYGLCQ